MSSLALILVLCSALLHAIWNLLAKRANGGMVFVWLFSLLASALYLPLLIGILIVSQPQIGITEIAFLMGSSTLHIAYYFLLNRGYRVGDLSLVYPLSRGTGPLLAAVGAIFLFGERPSPLALVGASLVASGVFILTGKWGTLRQAGALPAVMYGLLTGLAIASYTIWDKLVVGYVLIPPLLLTWFSNTVRVIVFFPHVLRQRDTLRAAWREHRREAIGIAVLDSLSYILFLIALSFSPVSYLAPARQVSILLGAFLGVRLLAEGDSKRRLVAAGVMVAGLVALTLG